MTLSRLASFPAFWMLLKNLEEKDGQRQLLYYVSLIRACNNAERFSDAPLPDHIY